MVDWVDLWGSEEKGWAVHFVQCGEKLLNLVDSFQSFQKYPEPKFITAEAQGTRGWRANSTQTPVEAPIDIQQPAVSLANISWQGQMTRPNFSGSPRTGEVPQTVKPM
jgi:hypothetical protein